MICIISIIFITSCSSKHTNNPNSPDASVNNFFNTIKKSDISKAKLYLVSNDTSLDFNVKTSKRIISEVFKKIKWNIISEKISSKSAIIDAKVTTPDMQYVIIGVLKEVVPQIVKTTLKENSADTSPTDKVTEQYAIKMLSSPNLKMITSNLKINLVKKNNKWLIKGNEDFKNVITGKAYLLKDKAFK